MTSSSQAVNRMLIDHPDNSLASSLLIAQRALEDIEAIHGLNKGKSREDEPLSDEEFAMKLQAEYLQDALRAMEDFEYAKTFNEGLEDQRPSLNVFDQDAGEYRQVILAMFVKDGLPGPSFSGTSSHRSGGTISLAEDEPCLEPEGMEQSTERLADNVRKLPIYVTPDDSEDEDEEVSEVIGSSRTLLTKPHGEESQYRKELLSTIFPSEEIKDKDRKVVEPTIAPSATQPNDTPIPFPDELGFRTIYCMRCGDLVVGEPSLRAPCGHDYCVDCIEDLITSCTNDESLFPPTCCSQPIPSESFTPLLTIRILSIFNSKSLELSVPSRFRIFCPNATCSAFLGSTEGATDALTCPCCSTSVCPSCRLVAHVGESCVENTATLEVRSLAQTNRWQTCPGCHAIVELTAGCNHMACRCGVEFCYTCGVRWKGCSC